MEPILEERTAEILDNKSSVFAPVASIGKRMSKLRLVSRTHGQHGSDYGSRVPQDNDKPGIVK